MLNKFEFNIPKGYQFQASLGLGAAPFPKDLSLVLSVRSGALSSATKISSEPSGFVPKTLQSEKDAETDADKSDKKASGNISIFYGSNVGACEELAYEMADQAADFGVQATVEPLDELIKKGAQISDNICIITSTYNGFPPDNAKKFMAWMEDYLPSGSSALKGKSFALCGVGNSQWIHTFHKCPLRVEHLLKEAGVKPLLPSCMLDVCKEWCEEYEGWCKALWPALLESMSIKAIDSTINSAAFNRCKQGSNLEVEFVDDDADIPTLEQYFSESSTEFLVRRLKILDNRELQYNNSERSTRHIAIALPNDMTYVTGGHIAIRPMSPDALISQASALLHLNGEETIVAGLNKKHAVEALMKRRAKMKVCQLLKLLDLTVRPTQKQLEMLADRAQCPPEGFKLRYLSSAEGKEEYDETIKKPGFTILEILTKYRSVKLTLADFVYICPILKVRYYSISSAPRQSGPNICSITVAVVDYTSGTGRQHKGLSSGMLAKCSPGSTILGYVHELSSNFHLPSNNQKPIIMIGPGTGIAPFMGFLEERKQKQMQGLDLGEAVLFFGCRSASHDFIYRKELDDYVEQGVLTDLFVAFSRDNPEEKVYVQHLIAKKKKLLWRLLEAGAIIYVCGDAAHMAPDVRKAIGHAIQDCSSRTKEETLAYLEGLQESNRYLEDVWG